jgi:amidase
MTTMTFEKTPITNRVAIEPNTQSYIYKSALELAHLIRTGQATSTAIVKAHLDQIDKHNPALNAVVILLREEALQVARECDEEAARGQWRGPLHGVPMTVKEQFWVKGTKCTLNFKMLKDWTAPADALTVERLKQAGAVILGKTNVPQNLLDYQVWGDIYPEGNNPYDLDRTPGGSSGGAAAALAAGLTPIELGADFGGSIRVPANYCGVYGLKPTENTVPQHGMGPVPENSKGFVSHMAQAGPLARTLEDLELVWNIIRGPHESDRTVPRIDWADATGKQLSDYKIAWVDGWPGYETSQSTQKSIKQLVESLEREGARLEQATPPNRLHERTLALYVRFFPQMIAQGVPGLIRSLMKMQIKGSLMKNIDKYHREYDKGFQPSFENYAETLTLRAELVSEWETFFKNYDLLICPMSYGPAFRRCKIGTPITYEGRTMIYVNYVWPYVGCFNASGHPALNMPLGLDPAGLPVGVQLVGSYWSEPNLLNFAKLASPLTPGFVKPAGY